MCSSQISSLSSNAIRLRALFLSSVCSRIAVRRIVDKKVFANWGKDVDQDHFFIQHGSPVAIIRRKVKHVSRGHDLHISVDDKFHLALHDERNLLMRMSVFGGYKKRLKSEATHHEVLADHHLPLDSGCSVLFFDRIPIGYKC